ncbi:MAG: sulfatase-like hydrolase/transferase [Lysobacteraceae bacterium]
MSGNRYHSALENRSTDRMRANQRQVSGRHRVCLALLLIAMSSSSLLVWWLDGTFAERFDAGLLLLNALPLTLLTLLVCGFCGRPLFSLLVAHLLVAVLYGINAVKYEQLERMLSVSDLALVSQVFGNLGMFLPFLHLDWLDWLVGILLVVALFLAWWLDRRWRPGWGWRLVLIVLPLFGLAGMMSGSWPWRGLMNDERLGGFQIWSPDTSLQRSGLLAGLLRLSWERGEGAPPPNVEDLAKLDGFLAAEGSRLDALSRRQAIQLPDIVVVQSEAMFDPAILDDPQFDAELPEFRRLAARGLHGRLTVPTYGGGTIRTEFEVLTGYPMDAFPGVQWPYFGLVNRPLPGWPRQLESLGYRSLLIHPYERSFWNRDSAARLLGFTELLFERDGPFANPARRGPYVSDDFLYEASLSLLGNDRPQFEFVVTIENHAPWATRRNVDEAERDAIPVPGSLDAAAATSLRNYLYHLRHGDVALGRFADKLLDRKRPTLLLVYGDHLANMGKVFDQLGFDDDVNATRQPTTYLVVANFPIASGQLDLATHELPAWINRLAGLPNKDYLAVSELISEKRRVSDEQEKALLNAINRAAALQSYHHSH